MRAKTRSGLESQNSIWTNTSAPKLNMYKQAAIEIVLRCGTLHSMPKLLTAGAPIPASDKVSKVEVTCTNMWNLGDLSSNSRPKVLQKCRHINKPNKPYPTDLDLHLTQAKVSVYKLDIWWPGTSSMISKESVMIFENGFALN